MRVRSVASAMAVWAVALGAAVSVGRAQEPPAGEASYEVRLRELEERVERLKQRVGSHPDRVDPAASSLVVEVDERLGPGLRVEGAEVIVHGQSQALAWERDAGGTERLRARVALPAGEAEVAVRVVVRGEGGEVFTYLRGYRTMLEASRSVRLPVLGEQAVQVVVWEGGSPTSTFCERPRIGFRVAVP